MSQDSRLVKYAKRGFGSILIDRDSLIGLPSSVNASTAAKLVVFKFKMEEDTGYDDAYLPYGSNWNPPSIRKFLARNRTKEIKQLKAKGEIKDESEYKPFFIFGTLEEIMDCKKDIGKIARRIKWETPNHK